MTVITNTCTSLQNDKQSVLAILKGAVLQLLTLAKRNYAARKQQRINRLAFSQMLELNDSLLADIGVGRDDVAWASKLPIEINAAHELDTIRKQAK